MKARRNERLQSPCPEPLLADRIRCMRRGCHESRKMQNQEWITTLEDGRKVKFIDQAAPGGGSFVTAQIAANEIVYSILLTKAGTPSNRKDVESHFRHQLSKK